MNDDEMWDQSTPETLSQRNELIEANLSLPAWMTRNKYSSLIMQGGYEFQDSIQDGTEGLIKAAESFDPNLGYAFSTYAEYWIGHYIQRGIGNRARTIRVPIYLVDGLRSTARAKVFLTQELQREPSPTEVVGYTNDFSESEMSYAQQISQPLESIDELVQLEDGPESLGGLTANRTEQSPLEQLIDQETHEQLAEAIELLPDEQREVIKFRFGLDGSEELTISETAKALGETFGQIRVIERKARKRLFETAFNDSTNNTEGGRSFDPEIERVLDLISKRTQARKEEITDVGIRERRVSTARQISAFIFRTELGLPLSLIARTLGYSGNAGVMVAIEHIQEQLGNTEEVKNTVTEVVKAFQNETAES